jgi:prepilin-type N-terminal cleavage/methylation domain-containing protein
MKKNVQGFTLIEIMIAMAIVAILSGVGFTAYTASLQRSRDSQRKADLSQIQRALETYLMDHSLYPEATADHKIDGCYDTDTNTVGITCEWGQEFVFLVNTAEKAYMSTLPRDPQAYQSYQYYVSSDLKKYQLFTILENLRDPSILDSLSEECRTGVNCNFGVSSSNSTISEILE